MNPVDLLHSPRRVSTAAALLAIVALAAYGCSDDSATATPPDAGPSTIPDASAPDATGADSAAPAPERDSSAPDSGTDASALAAPLPPPDPGFADTADPPADVLAFVDNGATNQQTYRTRNCNAAVRVLARFEDVWRPMTELVDAYGAGDAGTGAQSTICPASTVVNGSGWTGLPGTGQGDVVLQAVHDRNIQYVVDRTSARTAEEAVAAYMDDRQDQQYSMIKGMGPLTAAWLRGSQATTTITGVPADATTTKYDDVSNGAGVGGAANPSFGSVVDFINTVGANSSTEPSKKFFKYPRPFRWSASVVVAPTLVRVESTTPGTDGGFPSGHTNRGGWTALAMAYAVPERFQEMVTRASELGENRILAGMHSPLDVMGGRILSTAIAAANLSDPNNATTKSAAVAAAHTYLQAQTNTTPATFFAFAHSGKSDTDRYADFSTNKTDYTRRLTYGFAQTGDTARAAVVPKGAEVLLETRLPYLNATQRRVVLKTTALPSGYPLLDDPEGWGRLNLFAAADGYGAFHGNVVVDMDASKAGFFAFDRWRNDIGGDGKLTKRGTGALQLTGANSYSGGTQIEAGTLEGSSPSAFGAGDVYVGGGVLVIDAPRPLTIGGQYAELTGGTLELVLGGSGQGRIVVHGRAALGGALHVRFAPGYTPSIGDTLSVISSGSLDGVFATITVDGFHVTPTYTDHGVLLHIDS